MQEDVHIPQASDVSDSDTHHTRSRSPSPAESLTGSVAGSSVAGTQNTKEARQKFAIHPIEKEENILEWIRENDVLWRSGNMRYHEKVNKEPLWEKKALEEGIEVKHLK